MRHYLLLGVRRRPGMAARPHGPYATARLPTEQAAVLAETTAAAVACLQAGDWHPVRSPDRFVLTVLDGRGSHRLVEAPRQVHGPGPVPALFKLVWHVESPMLSAAEALAELCDLIAADRPAAGAREFLAALGQQAAGITPGAGGWADLAVGGHNVLVGDGFRPDLDDGSHRQARHFAGTAEAAARLGGRSTRVLCRLRGDRPGSPDDRLSKAAIDLAADLTAGRLAPAGVGDWIREHLLAP